MSFFPLSLAEGDVGEIILYSTLLQATRGARNPNVQVVITYALHVCSIVCSSTKNECNAQNAV